MDRKKMIKAGEFDYGETEELAIFKGSHPAIMNERIARQNWTYDRDLSRKPTSLKYKFKKMIERLTGWRVGEYKNYRLT